MVMNRESVVELDARTQAAIAELEGTISRHYPSAQFDIQRAANDPAVIHLLTTVEVDDPDEVGDLVIDRVVELIAEERIPIHVIPLRAENQPMSRPEPQPRSSRAPWSPSSRWVANVT